MQCSLPLENLYGYFYLTYEPFAWFPPNKLFILWIDLANSMCHRLVCVSWEQRVQDYLISYKLHLFSPFWHSSRYIIAHVQSQRIWQTLTCTPRHQLPSKLCLMRLGLRHGFLRSFSCPLLSFYIKWPLCIRYCCGTNLLLVLCSFVSFHKCLIKGAVHVKEIALAWSGSHLSSNVLNASIGHVAYVSTLMSLQQHGQTRPD